jgi:hypothetical protein
MHVFNMFKKNYKFFVLFIFISFLFNYQNLYSVSFPKKFSYPIVLVLALIVSGTVEYWREDSVIKKFIGKGKKDALALKALLFSFFIAISPSLFIKKRAFKKI